MGIAEFRFDLMFLIENLLQNLEHTVHAQGVTLYRDGRRVHQALHKSRQQAAQHASTQHLGKTLRW